MLTSSIFLLLLGPLDPINIIDERNGCSQCHSGAIQGTIENRFFVEDPEDDFASIDTYEEGKTYRIRVLFDPIANNGNYRVAFRVGAFREGQIAGEFEDPMAAGDNVFQASGWMAARIDTSNLALAEEVTFDWTAPSHGRDVSFFLSRVEANRNGGSGGDRGSIDESITLFGLNNDVDDDSSMSAGSGDGSQGASGAGSNGQLQSGSSKYGVNFSTGCMLKLTDESRPLASLVFLIVLGFSFLILRRRRQAETDEG